MLSGLKITNTLITKHYNKQTEKLVMTNNNEGEE